MKKIFASACFVLMVLLSKNAVSGSLNKYGEPDYNAPIFQQSPEKPVRKSQEIFLEVTEILKQLPEAERNKLLDQYQIKFEEALKDREIGTAKRYLEIIGEWR